MDDEDDNQGGTEEESKLDKFKKKANEEFGNWKEGVKEAK